MATPMFDMPVHLLIPVDENGDGPADDSLAVAWECVGDRDCKEALR
jgi:hypothetical protein